MAYEAKVGPLGPQWQYQRLAEIEYLLQWNSYLLGAQVTPQGKKNPVPEPQMPPRPWIHEDEDSKGEDEEEV